MKRSDCSKSVTDKTANIGAQAGGGGEVLLAGSLYSSAANKQVIQGVTWRIIGSTILF